MAFRIRKKDIANLRNAQATAKRQATKAQKLGVEVQFQKRDITSFKSRQEFNKYLKETKDFSSRHRYFKNANNVVINRNELEEIEKYRKKANAAKREATKKIKQLKETYAGKPTGVKVKKAIRSLTDERRQVFEKIPKINPNTITSPTQLKKRKQALKKQSSVIYWQKKEKELQKNYAKAILKNYGMEGSKELSKRAKNLAKKVKKMSTSDFIKIYYSEVTSPWVFQYIELSKNTNKPADFTNLEKAFGIDEEK